MNYGAECVNKIFLIILSKISLIEKQKLTE